MGRGSKKRGSKAAYRTDNVFTKRMRAVYGCISEITTAAGLQGMPRKYPVLDSNMPNDQIDSGKLYEAIKEELDLLRLYLGNVKHDLESTRREEQRHRKTLESVANSLGINPEDYDHTK